MNKFKIHTKYISIVLISLIIFGCEDVVHVEIDNQDLDLISVEAYIYTYQSNNIFVKLESSLPIDDTTQNPPISNANIQISDDELIPNTVLLKETSEPGTYRLPEHKKYRALPGRTYKITITTEDGTVITGEDYLQKVEPLDSVKAHLSPRGDYEFMAIFISTQETPGLGHYYKWDIYINNFLLFGSDNLAFASDELVDGNYIYDLEIFTDWYDDDEEEDENGNIDNKIIFIGDTVKVVQSTISRDIYNFYLGMQNQAFAGSPFSVPPANIPGNLTANNGRKILGIFSARDVSLGNSVIIDSTNFTPLPRETNF